MSRYVFACATTSVRGPNSKFPTLIHQGEAWFADAPLVLAHPTLFSDVPPVVHPRGFESEIVEQATATPGEKRTTKRAG